MKKKKEHHQHTNAHKHKRKKESLCLLLRGCWLIIGNGVFLFFARVFCPQTKASMALCKLGGVKERRDAATLPWRRHRPLDDLSGLRRGRSQLKVDTGRVPYRIASPTTSSPEASWENRSRAPTDGRK